MVKLLPMNRLIKIQLKAESPKAKKRPICILCRRHFNSLKERKTASERKRAKKERT